ncbi:heparinase II/III family protein [Pseudemcibacter aquimaris]|uniref:heparinase II/III family protein n=1 Tax=Pseudemcibacter aquimaris TaxID=2857064 RepID=UPI0020122E86|nr:heparinase II/III family protein [Pseudemcibacter aquimaris]MCC3861851.1 heparinase II/III family protein [Pseudemcibacter aquimaris]WDU58604.1 heparinase II/III family protein [Pseudemcibacter aquimaris]
MAQLRRKPVSSSEKKSKNPIAKAMSRARHSSFYHDLSLRGKNPLRLLGTPKDIWPGSATAGTKMVGGKILAAGHVLSNPNNEQDIWPGGDVWRAQNLPDKWQEYLHSFRWLRDLNQAVDRKGAKERAEELVESWIEENTQWGEVSWRCDIVGERVTNWLIYAPLIMDTDDVIYRGRVLDILARSARHLMKMSTDLPEGPGGLKAIIGLAFSGLFIPLGDSWLKQAVGYLKFSLGKEVLVDGGIRSRNPQELLHLFMHMVLLRDAFAGMGKEAPEELGKAVSRMASCIRALSHGDGKLPLFNGVTIERAEDINAVIEKAKEEYAAEFDLEQSGFARLENQKTVLIQDIGPPAEMELSSTCHAGALSFELSQGRDRIIVNSGNAAYVQIGGQDLEYISRSTAAHSTLVLNDQNSSDILDDGLIGRGITEVSSKLISENGHYMLDAEHNGYVDDYGLIHRRLIYMNDQGDDIRGEDELRLSYKGDKNPVPFNICFYLHPNISVLKTDDQIILETPSGKKWAFFARGADVAITESIYFGEAGKVSPSQQIRLSGKTDGEKTTTLWSLKLQGNDQE